MGFNYKYMADSEILGNDIIKHSSSTEDFAGVYIDVNSVGNLISGNTIKEAGTSGTDRGVSVYGSSNLITGNTIEDQNNAVTLWSGADDNYVVGNHVPGNVVANNGANNSCFNNMTELDTESTLVDGDTTPFVGNSSTSSVHSFQTNNSGATSITTFDSSYRGQVIIIVAQDANTTLVHHSSNLKLQGSVNYVMSAGDIVTLQRRPLSGAGVYWREISRMVA
jgi:hypothetical protein